MVERTRAFFVLDNQQQCEVNSLKVFVWIVPRVYQQKSLETLHVNHVKQDRIKMTKVTHRVQDASLENLKWKQCKKKPKLVKIVQKDGILQQRHEILV